MWLLHLSLYIQKSAKRTHFTHPAWITTQMDEKKEARERNREKKKGRVKTLIEFVS